MYSRLPKIDTPKIDTFYEIPRDFEKHNTLFGLYKTSTFILKIKYHSSPSESLHANLSKRSQRLRICSSRVSSTSIVGSPVLHPMALHFFMSLHPEGKNALHPKRHFIHNDTSSPNALRPEWHFILSALHLKGHFISRCTSSHNGTSS